VLCFPLKNSIKFVSGYNIPGVSNRTKSNKKSKNHTDCSVIERSIMFDWQNFIEFDYVRLSLAIERLVFDWVRLPNCSIGYAGNIIIIIALFE